MEKQLYFNLLTAFVVLEQAIPVASKHNGAASSALLIREKRASSSSGNVSVLPSSELHHRDVRFVPPEPWEGPLRPGMVWIYHGTNEIGIGVVIHTEPCIIVTKAHLFPLEFYAEEYHIKYNDIIGRSVKSYMRIANRNHDYIKNKEKPWGINDICLIYTDLCPQKAPNVQAMLTATRLFTRHQLSWVSQIAG